MNRKFTVPENINIVLKKVEKDLHNVEIVLPENSSEVVHKFLWLFAGTDYSNICSMMPPWASQRWESKSVDRPVEYMKEIYHVNLNFPTMFISEPVISSYQSIAKLYQGDFCILRQNIQGLAGEQEILNLLDTVLPKQDELLRLVDQARQLNTALAERASDAEFLMMFPILQKMLGKTPTRSRQISQKRQDEIKHGLDLTPFMHILAMQEFNGTTKNNTDDL